MLVKLWFSLELFENIFEFVTNFSQSLWCEMRMQWEKLKSCLPVPSLPVLPLPLIIMRKQTISNNRATTSGRGTLRLVQPCGLQAATKHKKKKRKKLPKLINQRENGQFAIAFSQHMLPATPTQCTMCVCVPSCGRIWWEIFAYPFEAASALSLNTL